MKLMNRVAQWTVAGALGAGVAFAHAAVEPLPFSVTAQNATAAGGFAYPSATYVFDAEYSFTALTFGLEYTAGMTFDATHSSLSFSNQNGSVPAVNFAVALAGLSPQFQVMVSPPAGSGSLQYNVLVSPDPNIDPPSVLTIPQGTLVFTAAFTLAPNFATGSATFTGGFFSTNFSDDKVPDGVIANVSAVPEPATWMLLLSGLGLLGAAARRRMLGGSY